MDSPEYLEWERGAPDFLKRDLLWKLPAYRFGTCVADMAYEDATRLSRRAMTKSLAEQLYRAASSIPANIAEGYAKQSGIDRARFYEYALGSAREAREHYMRARLALGPITGSRIELLSRVVAILVAVIPKERRLDRGKPPRP